MNTCKQCGSQAINNQHHGRDGSDPDLCDVCFWRKRAESPWIPIETAPKDGTHILAKNSEYGIRETFWRLYGDGSIAKEQFARGAGPSGYWNWTEPQNNWGSDWHPTIWIPLPPTTERKP